MPVASFVLGATAWTLLDHKPQASAGLGSPPRHVPVGVLHAVDPQDQTAICIGEAMVPDPAGRSFAAWQAGTCPACSAQVAPSARTASP